MNLGRRRFVGHGVFLIKDRARAWDPHFVESHFPGGDNTKRSLAWLYAWGCPSIDPNVCLGSTLLPFVSDVDLFSSSILNVSCCCYQTERIQLD